MPAVPRRQPLSPRPPQLPLANRQHRHLLPTLVVSTLPEIDVTNGELIEQRFECDEHGTNVLHITVRPTGTDKPEVNMKGGLPIDIAFVSRTAVIETLRRIASFVLTDVYEPLSQHLSAAASTEN